MIERAFNDQLGDQFKIDVEVVDRIEASEGGKYRLVISELAMDELRRSLQQQNPD